AALALSAPGVPAPPAARPAAFPVQPVAPKGAPNIIVILTDDVGFASGSTFGGAIPTPTMDRLADNGVRYANFHTTALCSPSRAALLTGRNHHAVGFGGVADFARGEPGYNSVLPRDAATLGRILKANGYDTAWLGKNHNVPSWESGPNGPFDRWATGVGFDYFYGFHGGYTSQFRPDLIENRTQVPVPEQKDYILDRDLADHAVGWLDMQRTQAPDRPFFLYYAPGSAHAPLHAPADWIARFKGRFDAGWDVYRQETFARQKRLGIIPAHAALAPLPPGIPAWDSLTPDRKRVYARHMEAYAAALAYCDDQIGRVLDRLKATGQLDNTIVVYIQGDNGATPEGGLGGTINYAGPVAPAEELRRSLARIDAIGGPDSYPVHPAGWSNAVNTPYPYYKVDASRLGGTTNGLVISWPKGIAERGVRQQFTHLVDVVPTLLELGGLARPASIDGVVQKPLDGVSFAYSLRRPDAPGRHHVQYFEIAGTAALYRDGWLAATPVRTRNAGGEASDPQKGPWQLYDLAADPSQTVDVAARYPRRLRELRSLFDREARRNRVYPIESNTTALLMAENRPEALSTTGRHILYPSPYRYPEGAFPSLVNRGWTISAGLDAPGGGGEGTLITYGGRFSGWGLVLLRGVPTFLYVRSDDAASTTRLAAPAPLDRGAHQVAVAFTQDGPGVGKGGRLVMNIDGRQVAETRLPATVAYKFQLEDGSVGHDNGTALTADYRAPFPFTGTLRSVTVDLQPTRTGFPAPGQ
ncbi:MAG: arylsulfatase, partial [Sphingobium sp.]